MLHLQRLARGDINPLRESDDRACAVVLGFGIDMATVDKLVGRLGLAGQWDEARER